jgi:metal-sulfur cluster biosynthetic enzyme
MIAASKAITDRLDFLRGLEELVLEPDISQFVKERSQLHRILASETWVFGEEYALAADDESLTTVLKRHLGILGRDDLAEEEVTDAEGHRRIVDLMLARSLVQHHNQREHLIVELKAPKVPVGDDEAAQIRKYAAAVAGDARFNIEDVEWDFYVISSEIRGAPDLERRESQNRPFGQIMDAGGIRVWALTWAEVLENANHRLKFVQKHLGYSPTAQQAFDYLRATHDKYLPDAVPPASSPN